MAEYYPLISRAVAGLRDGAPEVRQAIYGRARQALTVQLRGMEPPVPEEDINREIEALDAAIARIEGEILPAPSPVVPAAPKPPSVPPAPVPTASPVQAAKPSPSPSAPVPPAPAPGPSRLVSPPPPVPDATSSQSVSAGSLGETVPVAPLRASSSRPAAPLAGGASAPAGPRPDRLLFTPRSSLPSRAPASREPRPPVPRPPIETAKNVQEAAESTRSDPAAPIPPKPVLPLAPTLDVSVPPVEPASNTFFVPVPEARFEPTDGIDNGRAAAAPEIAPMEPRVREEAIRPAIPQSVATQPRSLRIWIVAVAALAAVVAIALTAWRLRDRPEELARAPVVTAQQPAAPNKINDRADGGASSDMESDPTTDTSILGDGAVQNPAPAPSPAPAAPQAAATEPAASTQPAGDQAIPVSYKAAVLVDAPDTPEKVKTYIGTVVWRSESVSQGQDQPLGTAVRADVDIPDAKIQLVMEIRKNTEAQFPASHTIDLKFTVATESPVGGVKQISVPQMRREDMPTGDSLTGVPVSITDNYFLVGLTRGDAEARNMEAIRTRAWFDIPMLLESGKPAKITFEKGASGERIINDALQTWSKP